MSLSRVLLQSPMVSQDQEGGGRGGKKSKQVAHQFYTMTIRALGWKREQKYEKGIRWLFL